MELKQIVKTIERQYPKEEAMEWDNVSGLRKRRLWNYQRDFTRLRVL